MLFSGPIKQVKKTDSWEVVVGGGAYGPAEEPAENRVVAERNYILQLPENADQSFQPHRFRFLPNMKGKGFLGEVVVAHQKMDLVWRWYQSRSGKYSCANQTNTQSYPNNSPTNNPD